MTENSHSAASCGAMEMVIITYLDSSFDFGVTTLNAIEV